MPPPRAAALSMWAPPAVLVLVWTVATAVGPTSDTDINDLYVYSFIRDQVLAGDVPYRDFLFEYPPLALLPIVLGNGAVALSILMLASALALQALCGALAGPRAAWLFVALPVVCGALVRTHFDLLPAALTVGALVAVTRGRPALAGALLGAGAMTKLFPALLVGVFAAWLLSRGQGRAAVRCVAAAAAVIAVVLSPFVVLGGLDNMVRFHLERPVQIESVPASVLFVLGGSEVTGNPLRPDRFKSNGLDGGSAVTVQILFAVASIVVIALVTLLAARRGRGTQEHLILATLGVLLAFVALGKVLSPQFVIWLAPFAALLLAVRGRGHRAIAGLLIAATAVTQLEFPSRYFDLVAGDDSVVALVGLRNVLLLTALSATVAALARSPRRDAVQPHTGSAPH